MCKEDKIIKKEQIELLRNQIDIPITYKKMCSTTGFPYLKGNAKSCFLNNLLLWVDLERTSSPTRYIVKKIYDDKKEKIPTVATLPNDEEAYEEAKQFFIKRKITPVEPLPYPIRRRYQISYTCPFHPEIIHTTTWKILKDSIGCPICKYPYSRFEIMVYLGTKGAESRVKFDGVEFDIYIPELKTVVEIDGYYFHKNDSEEQIERKILAAQSNGLKLLKILEVEAIESSKIGIEDNIFYIVPYGTANIKDRKKIIKGLSNFLPFTYTDTLWDEAAEYMRENKLRNAPKLIKQYDKFGNLLNTYTEKKIINEISTGFAFGYNWSIE